MSTKHLFLAGFAMLFFSCASDDSDNPPVANNEDTFSHFTVTTTTTNADGSPGPGNSTFTENLVNEKRFSVTQNGETAQRYFYTDGLISAAQGYHFYYDASGLVAIDRIINQDGVAISLYYRFVNPSSNVMFCEKMSTYYNDPDAEILYRNILEFDADGNVVKAGPDADLDGVMDHSNTFAYSDGDLVSIQFWNGSTQSFSYSTTKDNFYVIDGNTFGKKVLRAMCAEAYVSTNWETNLGHSKHVLLSEPLNPAYEVLASNFYKKRTTVMPLGNGAHTDTVVEFFFN